MKVYGLIERGSYKLSIGVIVAETEEEAKEIAKEQMMFDEDESYWGVEEIDLTKTGYTHLGSYME